MPAPSTMIFPVSIDHLFKMSGDGEISTSEKTKHPNGFRIDSDISNCKSVVIPESTLERWMGKDEEVSCELSMDKGGKKKKWNQFDANKSMFGVNAKFDESLYTTSIDKSHPDYKARKERADMICKQIAQMSLNGNFHIADKHNIAFNDHGINEEDKYCGVNRSHQGFKAQKRTGKASERNLANGNFSPCRDTAIIYCSGLISPKLETSTKLDAGEACKTTETKESSSSAELSSTIQSSSKDSSTLDASATKKSVKSDSQISLPTSVESDCNVSIQSSPDADIPDSSANQDGEIQTAINNTDEMPTQPVVGTNTDEVPTHTAVRETNTIMYNLDAPLFTPTMLGPTLPSAPPPQFFPMGQFPQGTHGNFSPPQPFPTGPWNPMAQELNYGHQVVPHTSWEAPPTGPILSIVRNGTTHYFPTMQLGYPGPAPFPYGMEPVFPRGPEMIPQPPFENHPPYGPPYDSNGAPVFGMGPPPFMGYQQ